MNIKIRASIIIAIVLGWVGFYSYIFATGVFDKSVFLPFHLCNIMEIVIVFALWKNNQRILDIVSYPLVLGPVAALAYPIGTFSMGGIFAVYFVYYHLLLLLTGVLYLRSIRFQTKRIHIFQGAIFIFSCDVVAAVVNALTGGNYMFIGETGGYPALYYYPTLFLLVWIFLLGFHGLIKIIANIKFKAEYNSTINGNR